MLTSSNPQQQQPLTVTPASGGFPNLNGTSLYRQSFGQSNGNATFPPTAALLQNQSPTLQNGTFSIFHVSMEPFFSYPLLDYFNSPKPWRVLIPSFSFLLLLSPFCLLLLLTSFYFDQTFHKSFQLGLAWFSLTQLGSA